MEELKSLRGSLIKLIIERIATDNVFSNDINLEKLLESEFLKHLKFNVNVKVRIEEDKNVQIGQAFFEDESSTVRCIDFTIIPTGRTLDFSN